MQVANRTRKTLAGDSGHCRQALRSTMVSSALPSAGQPRELRSRSMNRPNYLETKDGAKIYYEDQGNGQPILLVHGWTCSSQLWQRNVPELTKEFRVVTLDLRGHGNSSKTLAGHTVGQYARDLRQLVEHLGLQDIVLAGWSMGGSVVLSYYEQYSGDSRLKALALVDIAPFPFSPAAWNSHTLRNWNFDGMNAAFARCRAGPREFAMAFTARMFKQKRSDAEMEWVATELMKTPPWIAEAAYSDFVMSDYSEILPDIRVPVIVFAANSSIFCNGIAMGKTIASQVPQATFVPFEDAGHILFFEQPQKFNTALAEFIKAVREGIISPDLLASTGGTIHPRGPKER